MILLELCEHFWDLMDDPHQTVWEMPQVVRLLNRGMGSVVRSIEDADSSHFGECKEYAVTAAPTTELYFDLPDDYRRLILIERVVPGADPLPANMVPFSQRHRGTVVGDPGFYDGPVVSLMGRRFVVMNPKDAYTLRLWYSKVLADMEDNDDEPLDIPRDYHELIVLEAAKRAFGTAEKEFPKDLEDLRRQQLAQLMVAITPRQRQGPRYVRYVSS